MKKAQGIIRKVGSQFCIFSEKGKRLSCHPTREAAVKRLRQIEFFKNQKGSLNQVISFLKKHGSDFEPDNFDSLDAAAHPRKNKKKRKM